MFFEYWPILFVDDEPDVLAISKLAMKNFEVYGLPVKIYTAASKADATMRKPRARWRSRFSMSSWKATMRVSNSPISSATN